MKYFHFFDLIKRIFSLSGLRSGFAFCILGLFSFTALAAPRKLSFSPSSLYFSVEQNGTTANKTSSLSANKGKPYIFLVKSGNSNWLVLPAGRRSSLSFGINVSGMAPGTYNAVVTAYAFGYTSATLKVTLTVNPIKALSFSPASLAFLVAYNGTTASKFSTLSASTNAPRVSLMKSTNSRWLILPSAATGSLTFGINAKGLNPGDYNSTVTAIASGYRSAILKIKLTVTAPKTLLFSPAILSFTVAQNGTVTNKSSVLSSSSGQPKVALAKSANSSWLILPSAAPGSLSFGINAMGLAPGKYNSTVSARATGYDSAILQVTLAITANSSALNIKVNFQDSATVTPPGWLRDYGQPYGSRAAAYQGRGYSFGWLRKDDNAPLDLTKNGRNRTAPADILLATLMHMQAQDLNSFSGTPVEGIWQTKIANGKYDVVVSAGDNANTDSKHYINVEGESAIAGFVATSTQKFTTASLTVSVTDGFLTIDATGGTNTKINWVTIQPARPTVITVNPSNGAINMRQNSSISTDILKLPNSGINNSTITASSVFLTENTSGTLVPSNVNGTGGGDAITLVPSSGLKLNTTYKFHITTGVKDLSGASFYPYTSTFTVTSTPFSSSSMVQFDKINLPNAAGRHSNVTIGPDGKLYAVTIDGIIKRFPLNADGTLGTPQLIYSIQDASGARSKRLAIGFAFDPSATATNLVAWITHSTYVFNNGPEWDGKLSRLSGTNLQISQEILINLPRSAKDHLTNSIAFGPDRALYFTQGSNSAMGQADNTWMNRSEHLLSCAILKLDISKLGALPLDVKTKDGGGTYNPYAVNAPLTIYASGVRNAFDLVWHSNGSLYVPTNGSGAGGNTPPSSNGSLRPDGTTYNGPGIPALTNVQQTMNDYLFKINKGGYYGHPNPERGEYVLNGGNPTSGTDKAEVSGYPPGTLPDVNWRGSVFDFKNNASPDGVIEYKSNIFNGALKGKLLVVRYSQHDDIITLTPDSNKVIASYIDGNTIPGFSGFIDPLDLTEDVKTGNIYVSEYGGDSGKIILLRPNTTGNMSPVSASRKSYNPEIYPNTIPSCDEVGPGSNSAIINVKQLLQNDELIIQPLNIHPNPAHMKFNITFPAHYPGVSGIQLVDLYGKTYNLENTQLSSSSNMAIDLTKLSLSPGIYFLKIKSLKQKTGVFKIVLL